MLGSKRLPGLAHARDAARELCGAQEFKYTVLCRRRQQLKGICGCREAPLHAVQRQGTQQAKKPRLCLTSMVERCTCNTKDRYCIDFATGPCGSCRVSGVRRFWGTTSNLDPGGGDAKPSSTEGVGSPDRSGGCAGPRTASTAEGASPNFASPPPWV
jgi:hypothetical protein